MLVRNLRVPVWHGVCCCSAVKSGHRAPRLVLRPVSVSTRTLSLSSLNPSSGFRLPPEPDPSNFLDNVDAFSKADLQIVSSAAEETVVKLADLGLGNWSDPAGWVQRLLDMMHNDIGLEWWQAIIALSMIVNTVLLPVSISWKRPNTFREAMQEQKQKAHEAKQKVQELENAKDSHSNSKPNFQDLTKIRLTQLEKTSIVCTLAIYSYFVGIRGMTKASFPGWESGGILWFPDLTVPDPTLAIISGLTIAAALGVNAGNLRVKPKYWYIKYVLWIGQPLLATAFISFQPSALGVYWCCSNMHNLVLTLICKTSMVRRFLGFETGSKPAKPQLGTQKKQSTTPQRAKSQTAKAKPTPPVPEEEKTETPKSKKMAPTIYSVRNEDREAFRAARKGNKIKDNKTKK